MDSPVTAIDGSQLLLFVDGFALFANSSPQATMKLKDVIVSLLNNLGLQNNPTKVHHIATQVGEHLGMTLGFDKGVFRALKTKFDSISELVK